MGLDDADVRRLARQERADMPCASMSGGTLCDLRGENVMAARPHRFVLHCIAAVGALVGAAALAESVTAAPADDPRTCIETSSDATIAACTRAITSGKFKQRDLASLHAARGAELSRRGQHDPALADLDLAIKLNPQAALPYYDRGNVHAVKNEIDAAIADYGQAIRLYPEFAAAYATRGSGHLAKDDLAAAIADFDQALRLDPKMAFTYSNRGMAYLKLNQTDRAIADYDTALKLEPNQPYAQYGRGVAKLRKGDTQGGNADIAVAKVRRSDVAEVLARVGVVPPGSVSGSTSATPAPAPAPSAASAPPAAPLAPAATFAPVALGEAPVKTVFEKHKLLGFFAPDCGKPASKDNLYYANRLNGELVQTDQMSSSTDRDFVMFIDKAGEISANEIVVTGTREGQPTNMIWRLESAPGASGMRVRPAEVSWGGKKLVTGEKLADSGREMPWLQRCGAPG